MTAGRSVSCVVATEGVARVRTRCKQTVSTERTLECGCRGTIRCGGSNTMANTTHGRQAIATYSVGGGTGAGYTCRPKRVVGTERGAASAANDTGRPFGTARRYTGHTCRSGVVGASVVWGVMGQGVCECTTAAANEQQDTPPNNRPDMHKSAVRTTTLM